MLPLRSTSLLTLALCIAPAGLWAAADDDDLPEGPAKETLVKMCSNCHALKQVVKKRYSKKFWETVVDDMVSRGAEGTEEETEAVVSYLTRHFGKPVKINEATAKEIQVGLSFNAADAESIVRYRTENGAFKSYEDVLKIKGLNAKVLDEQKKNIAF